MPQEEDRPGGVSERSSHPPCYSCLAHSDILPAFPPVKNEDTFERRCLCAVAANSQFHSTVEGHEAKSPIGIISQRESVFLVAGYGLIKSVRVSV